jgi:hypothetical protein
MTDEQMNVAISEACGWTDIHDSGPWHNHKLWGYPPELPGQGGNAYKYMPDYVHDLNAMHEAEKVLTDDQFKWYTYWVEKLMPETKYRCYLCATARHRAEAFVRSMGKWATDKDSLTVQPVTEDSSVAGKEVQP